MIDDDDATVAALLIPSGGGGAFGCIFTIVGFVLFLIVYAVAQDNKADCHKKKCEQGQPQLIKGACLCVTEAK